MIGRPENQVYEIERNIILESVIRKRIPLSVNSDLNFFTVDSSSIKILDYKIILVENPNENLLCLDGKTVDVSFIYNDVRYSFKSCLKKISAGIAFVMPLFLDADSSDFSSENADSKKFSVELFFEATEKTSDGTVFKNKRTIECLVRHDFISHFGSSVCAFEKISSAYISEPLNPSIAVPEVLFLSRENIVIAFQKKIFEINENDEFALWLKFPLKRPLNERKIYVSFVTRKISHDSAGEKSCVFGKFSGIKLEDVRFLDEMFR